MTLENETNENTTEPTKPVETPADQSTAEPMAEQGAAPTAKITDPEMAEFESLIGSYLSGIVQHEVDTIIKVPIVQIHSDNVLVDLGDKAEGLIDIQEFFDAKGNITISVGEVIDVQVLGRDDETGLIQVSYKRARSHVARQRLVQAFEKGLPISGRITRSVKSGLIVDLGMDCFMPASQISDSRVENIDEWVGKEVDVLVVDYDERKNRAVVSRRRLVEQGKKKALAEALERLHEGTEVQGRVANIVNFGAFLHLEGVDAFLPRDEISWDRGVTPAEALTIDSTIAVKILTIDRETGRIKVSRKALTPDPWLSVENRFPVGTQIKGQVVSITRFGAFIHIEEGLTGLIHVTDLSWSKSPQRVNDFLKEGDQVEAAVIAVDVKGRRLSLGLKQLVEDPWLEAEKQFPKGSRVKGIVTGLASFGAFVKLSDEVEGLIHISDLVWEGNVKHPGDILKTGDEVEAIVLKTDRASRRISLGRKQLLESPRDAFMRAHPLGSIIEGEVVRMIPAGAFLTLAPQIDGFLPVSQISQERVEKPEMALKIGEKITCKIIKVERERGAYKISLSRKALLNEQEARDVRQYTGNSKEGGVKLGELFKGLDLSGLKKE